ncbi:MAG: dTDP-glucose 4,6-dehydratase [Proteobacteria bacterium]|jgi:dTDP-glucose 4,6-dehydratase|nr:dTDP-glucose 4,6-dehydratase [Pseudomonadota bacterium]
MPKIVVTGGCGFIGSNFLVRFVPEMADSKFVNVDKLTYAGNPASVAEIANAPNYEFARVDVADVEAVRALFDEVKPDWVFHFAAESHVDRSIHGPREFFLSNVIGTVNLLEACRQLWKTADGHVFHHVSTDEVYGSLGAEGAFKETTPYDPSSPYSASKAASDHAVRAYHRTYGLPVVVTNCSNNYGPRQFPEKLVPLMILNALEGKPLPVYGRGANVRDWLFVEDHCEAIMAAATRGAPGTTYNIGGSCELANLDVVRAICDAVAEGTGKDPAALRRLVTFVADRPGHDFRYAMDTAKIRAELGWEPRENFATGMKRTVRWYLDNPGWIDGVRTGEYRKWMETNYSGRTAR